MRATSEGWSSSGTQAGEFLASVYLPKMRVALHSGRTIESNFRPECRQNLIRSPQMAMAAALLRKWRRPRQREIAPSPHGIVRESFVFPQRYSQLYTQTMLIMTPRIVMLRHIGNRNRLTSPATLVAGGALPLYVGKVLAVAALR